MKRNITVIKDPDGNNVVVINDILFKGKRSIDWIDVKNYLKRFVGEVYSVAATDDIVFLGSELPSEYTGSIYTKSLKGTLAKAKANASQGLPEMIETAQLKSAEKNHKKKHGRDAKFGWYRYETRFAIPVYDDSNELCRYNVFRAVLLIRHAASGKKYLYDVTEIKKETSKSCRA